MDSQLFLFILFVISLHHYFADTFSLHMKRKFKRIVGGDYVDTDTEYINNKSIKDASFMAYLELLLINGSGYRVCGGTILNSRYILTAAHCLNGAAIARIRIGSVNRMTGGQEHYSENLNQHPMFDEANDDYDVGLIKTQFEMNIDGTMIKAVNLVDVDTPVIAGRNVVIYGWGVTSEDGTLSNILKTVKLPITSLEFCQEVYYGGITENQFCAGQYQKDSCTGDSGGPAMSETTSIQQGIVSYGLGCGRKDTPGVYTNIAKVLNFILENSVE